MVKVPESCRKAECCFDISLEKPELVEGEVGILMVFIFVPMLIGVIACIALTKLFGVLEERGMLYARAKQLFAQTAVVITWFGCTSWGVQKYVNPCTDFDQWFNGEEGVTGKTVLIGMVANVVFGFIDNAGLFFGGCYLDEVFALLPGNSDANVTAGYGNTFSDALGSFLGTFVGLILSDATGVSEGPLWANCLGIIVGCLFGILVPKLILGNSSTTGLNKVSARQVLLGSMEIDELEAIVDGKKSLFDFRVERTFKKLDKDGSGSIDTDEIREYMKEAMGDDFNEEQLQKDLKNVFQIHKDSNDQEVDLQEFRDIYKQMASETLRNRKKELEMQESKTKENAKVNSVTPMSPHQDLEKQQNDQVSQQKLTEQQDQQLEKEPIISEQEQGQESTKQQEDQKLNDAPQE